MHSWAKSHMSAKVRFELDPHSLILNLCLCWSGLGVCLCWPWRFRCRDAKWVVVSPFTTLAVTNHLDKMPRDCVGYQADNHYVDVIMGTIASQITSLTIGYSIVYSVADQRKHQSSASLAFVRGIHRGPVNSPHKWPVTRKMFPLDDVIMYTTTST